MYKISSKTKQKGSPWTTFFSAFLVIYAILSVADLRLLQRRHALGTNRHGREVVQQGRGRGGKYFKETCGQERRVEGDDKAVVRLDAVHELRTQCAEFGEVARAATGTRYCSLIAKSERLWA